MDLSKKAFARRFAALKEDRQPWEAAWKDIQKYIMPTRGCFDDNRPGDNIAIDHKVMIDGEPLDAALVLASGMMSGLTSPAMPWFRLGVADPELNEYQPVRAWSDQVCERMMSVFAKSNIYDALYNCYEEIGPFGTAAMALFEDYTNVIRAAWYTCGEYYLAPDEHGRIRTFARSFYLTVENMIAKFGRENVSDNVRRMFDENHLYDLVRVCHLIEPNDGRDPQRKDNQNMPFRSVYWEEAGDADKVLLSSGFEQCPVMAPRWGVRTMSDAYGRGAPGWRALGDSKTLQAMNREELKGLAKLIDPPLQAPANTKGAAEVINALPGGLSYYGETENARIFPLYEVKPDINAIELGIWNRQQKINRYFYADLFKMLEQRTGPQMTAREVAERHEEKMMVLSPVLQRIETELLDPLIERTFHIMLKAGLVPEPPEELQGMDIQVEYISVLAQAQKMVGTANIEQFANFAGGLVAVQPEILDKIDLDEMIEEYGERTGVSAKIIRDEETVRKIRQERMKQQQMQQAMDQAGQMVQGAKVLSETKTEEPNALTALLGSTGPGGGIA